MNKSVLKRFANITECWISRIGMTRQISELKKPIQKVFAPRKLVLFETKLPVKIIVD